MPVSTQPNQGKPARNRRCCGTSREKPSQSSQGWSRTGMGDEPGQREDDQRGQRDGERRQAQEGQGEHAGQRDLMQDAEEDESCGMANQVPTVTSAAAPATMARRFR
jgi:hypothetical protein